MQVHIHTGNLQDQVSRAMGSDLFGHLFIYALIHVKRE